MANTFTTDRSSMLEALWAPGPHPDRAEHLDLYGQFVGEWDFDWTGYDTNGEASQTAVGEWLFDWGLDGRAVVDVWICPSRTERARDDAPSGEHGATVRFYDPAIEAWRVTWMGPAFGNVRAFIATLEGDEIVQRGTTPDGHELRWIFSDITRDSFRWRSQVSEDGGGNWRIRERMEVRRRRVRPA